MSNICILIESRLEFLDMELQLLSESTKYELIGMRMTASNINIFDFTLTIWWEVWLCDADPTFSVSNIMLLLSSMQFNDRHFISFFVQSSLFQKVNSQSVLTQEIMKLYFRMVIINIRFYYNYAILEKIHIELELKVLVHS